MRRCSVSGCGATSKNDPLLCFHGLPVNERRRKKWMKMLEMDEECTKLIKSIYVCSLHFPDGKKTYTYNYPTIFPGSKEWPSVIDNYNMRKYIRSCETTLAKPCSSRKRSKTPDPLEVDAPCAKTKNTQAEFVDEKFYKKLLTAEKRHFKVSQLYFRSQHSDQWLEFHHQRAPALSCMAQYSEQQGVEISRNSSSNASSLHLQVSNTTPNLAISTEKVDSDGGEYEDPATLLSAGKITQLMKLLQNYRNKNRISSTSSSIEHRSFPGKIAIEGQLCTGKTDTVKLLREYRENKISSASSEEHLSFPGESEQKPVCIAMEDVINDRNMERQMMPSPLSPGEQEFEGFSLKDVDFAKAKEMIPSPLSPGEQEFEGFSLKDVDFAKAKVHLTRTEDKGDQSQAEMGGLKLEINDSNMEGQMTSSPLLLREQEFEGFSLEDVDFAKARLQLRKVKVEGDISETEMGGLRKEPQTTDQHATSIEESERGLPQDPLTITIEGITYMSVLKSHEEAALADYITRHIMSRNGNLNISDICKFVYDFCVHSNAARPRMWNINKSADVEWLKGFSRRYSIFDCNAFYSKKSGKPCNNENRSKGKNNESNSKVKNYENSSKGKNNESSFKVQNSESSPKGNNNENNPEGNNNESSFKVNNNDNSSIAKNNETTSKGKNSKYFVYVVRNKEFIKISPVEAVRSDHNYAAEPKWLILRREKQVS